MQQYLTVDFAIVAFYLLLTLVVGLVTSRGIKTMKNYVIGDRKRRTTPVLVATFFATVVGAGATVSSAEKIFAGGLIWICVGLGSFLDRILMAYYIAPQVNRFREKLSVGEMMGGFSLRYRQDSFHGSQGHWHCRFNCCHYVHR